MDKFMSTGRRANRPANRIKKYISRAAAVLAGAGMFAGAVVFCIGSGSERIEEEAYLPETEIEQTDAALPEETEMPFVNRTFARAAGDYVEITVEADGRSIVVPAAVGCTAAEVLDKAGVVLGEDDELSVDISDTFSRNSTITLNRVEYVEKTYTREYELDTEYIEDDSLSVGDSKVVTDGEKGELLVKVRAKIVDGENVDSEIISKEITVKAVRPVVAMGTMEVDSYSYAAGGDDEDAPGSEEISELVSSRSEKYDTDSYEESLSDEEDMTVTAADSITEGESEDTENEAEEAQPEDADSTYSVWVRPEPEIPEITSDEPEPEVTAAPEQEETVDGMATVAGDDEGICLDGSRPVSRFSADKVQLDENGIPLNYKEVHRGESCAYTAEEDALMSTGKTVFQGYVAVDPDIIPYGSELYIVADDGAVYGYAVAADTGYSVSEGHIIVDLFMADLDDCLEWGRRDVTIYVL